MNVLPRFHALFEDILSNKTPTEQDTETMAELMLNGSFSDVQLSAMLTAMRMRGETTTEFAAFARIMRKHCTRVFPTQKSVTDIVGSGGDGSGSINVSTISAIVTAAAGIPVAKHGSRSVSSPSGSSDLMEKLGVNIQLNAVQAVECLDKAGIVFLFAPLFHPLMKNVAPVRKELKIRTIFNVLGPLVNPAFADVMLLGVFNRRYLPLYTETLQRQNVKSAYIVSSLDGLDEVSLSADTEIVKLADGKTSTTIFNPEQYGFKKRDKATFTAETPEENAVITREILSGKGRAALTELIVINSGFAISAARGVTLEKGFAEAEAIIKSAKGIETLERFIQISRSFR